MLTRMNRIMHLTIETAAASSNGVRRAVVDPSRSTAFRCDRP
jgi:hypothetical protein